MREFASQGCPPKGTSPKFQKPQASIVDEIENLTGTSQSAVEFRDVSYRLPDGGEILHQLNLNAAGGEILVLLGRSGSGKTTALKLVNRLREASSGEIKVEGRATSDWNSIQLRRRV